MYFYYQNIKHIESIEVLKQSLLKSETQINSKTIIEVPVLKQEKDSFKDEKTEISVVSKDEFKMTCSVSNNDDISGWDQCVGIDGFEVSYPENAELVLPIKGGPDLLSIEFRDVNKPSDDTNITDGYLIVISGGKLAKSFDAYINEAFLGEVPEHKNIKFNGYDARQFVTDDQSLYEETYFINTNDAVYKFNIQVVGDETNRSEYKKTINQILENIKLSE